MKLLTKKMITRGEMKAYITLLNPFAPHLCEEMWQSCGFDGMLNQTSWPLYDDKKCKDTVVEIAVQVNGKVRGRVTIDADCSKETALEEAKSAVFSTGLLEGKKLVKEIYVPGKLVNIVIK